MEFDITEYTDIALKEDGNVYVWGQNMSNILELDNDDSAVVVPIIVYSLGEN